MAARAAIVVGVGAQSGLGAALARRFAREGLCVVLVGRTLERLELVATDIRANGGKARVAVADVTNEDEVTALFNTLEAPETLELVAYNVGSNVMVPSLEMHAADFEDMWRQNALGGFLIGRQAIRTMLPCKRGSVIYTGATASLRARPGFMAFASAKAALRAVAQGFAREFGPQGIHVAHVVIDGVIRGDYARERFAGFVKAKGSDGLLELEDIAETYWTLHQQPRSAWTHELDLRPFKEAF
ncbi:SDR family NAD(P)-dependent oxidoreductase [Hyphomicrobium sp. DMF-1]|uniref:SDR family NAD(P)-dependent oxidoreductase n=1 Tax=Hyphomicrobium sp. DMF-1 TaxID=3019544 RepID=UPI0022EBDD14|nr:SDR family NAD(P)-dependent oxidoreductase [Hyphomicrobium sp. DMF-1]WBT37888.1 SDR family NAD(P)-dependent oxidoreductase [Hyphomicrobium sp. DMF-1]